MNNFTMTYMIIDNNKNKNTRATARELIAFRAIT